MTRRRLAVAAAALLALVLSGCAGLPTSGPVNASRVTVEEDRDTDFSYIPDRPVENATPAQVVEGFLAAGSGPKGNWSVAREFLAPSFRDVWNPRAGVLVHTPGAHVAEGATPDAVEVSVVPVATVDHTGAYATAAGGVEAAPIEFRLEQGADEQWRIVQAPNGIIIDEQRFATVFRAYPIMYFDPTWTYLVPDERWYPRLEAATSIADALVNGEPSPWLADAVASAFTEESRRSQGAVPLRQGIAQVSLDPSARNLDQVALDRMQTQLESSFAAAGIPTVQMMVDDQVLPAVAAATRRTAVDPRPLVLTAAGFGFLSGDTLEALPGLSAGVASLDDPPLSIEVDADHTAAVVRTADGGVVRIDADGEVVPLVDARSAAAPSIDPFGVVWTVPDASVPAIALFSPDGKEHRLAEGLLGVTRVDALQVSRDGTRLVVAGREGSVETLWVAGIRRDRDGVPTGVSAPRVLASLDGPATQVLWLDAVTVAALTETSGGEWHVHEQRLGGNPAVVRAPPDAVAMATGGQTGGVRVLDAAGVLHLQRGGTWQRPASDILVLATQQGLPQQ